MIVDRALAAGFAVATAVLLAATSPRAAPMETGNHFLPDCIAALDFSNPDTFRQGMCMGSVAMLGQLRRIVVNGRGERLYCPPDEATNGQLVRVVIRYLQNNPAKLHLEFMTLALSAFIEAFPCNDGATPGG